MDTLDTLGRRRPLEIGVPAPFHLRQPHVDAGRLEKRHELLDVTPEVDRTAPADSHVQVVAFLDAPRIAIQVLAEEQLRFIGCMFQRVAVCAVGVLLLIAFLQNPGRRGAAVYAFLTLLFAGAGAGFAARQIWLQSLPKDQVPACGMGLNYMLETLPLTEVIGRVLKGSGECAEQGWLLLGLAIPAWTFVFFIAMIAAAMRE